MDINKNIKRMRENAGYTQTELAKNAGVSQAAIAFFERGTKMPSVAALCGIADTLHCSVDELIGRKIS